MWTENRWALKEWAVVCAALAKGRQTLILRKGGIAEGPQGFQVEQPEFWLLPTRFHQSADELQPDAAPLLVEATALAAPAGQLRIDLYAVVEGVLKIDHLDELDRLIPRQVLSALTVRERFHYRRLGLFAIEMRVQRLEQPRFVADRLEYAGCHSWVELAEPLATAGLLPVTPCRDHETNS